MNDTHAQKENIRETLALYCFYTDGGEGGKWVDLFTEDCIWDGGPFGYCGDKAALRAFNEKTGDAGVGLKHINTNLVIAVEGDEASVKSYVLVLGKADQGNPVLFAGHYEDQMVRRDGRWLFKRRTVHTDLSKMVRPS